MFPVSERFRPQQFECITQGLIAKEGPVNDGGWRDLHIPVNLHQAFFDASERDPARRYKLFCRASDQEKTIGVAFSADGLRWSELQLCPEISVPGDTHNNAFWAPELGRYVGITRLRTDQRLVARTESPDFVHWTKAVEVLRGDPLNQTYAMPVFRHAGVYLSLPMIFRTGEDRVHCELAWSPDTLAWHRIASGQPLIANSNRQGDYDWGCVYAAATPVFHEQEIRLYYGASNGPHTNWRDSFLALATLRPDGFAGFETAAGGHVGRISTKPLPWAGSELQITADVTGGEIGVTLQNEAGAVVATAEPVTATSTDRTLRWKHGFEFARLQGTAVRVAFAMTSAKLYSFNFAG